MPAAVRPLGDHPDPGLNGLGAGERGAGGGEGEDVGAAPKAGPQVPRRRFSGRDQHDEGGGVRVVGRLRALTRRRCVGDGVRHGAEKPAVTLPGRSRRPRRAGRQGPLELLYRDEPGDRLGDRVHEEGAVGDGVHQLAVAGHRRTPAHRGAERLVGHRELEGHEATGVTTVGAARASHASLGGGERHDAEAFARIGVHLARPAAGGAHAARPGGAQGPGLNQ